MKKKKLRNFIFFFLYHRVRLHYAKMMINYVISSVTQVQLDKLKYV